MAHAPVRNEPLPRLLLQLLLPAALWGVVVAGRRICLVAQRMPPAVRLVRAVYRWKDARRPARSSVAG